MDVSILQSALLLLLLAASTNAFTFSKPPPPQTPHHRQNLDVVSLLPFAALAKSTLANIPQHIATIRPSAIVEVAVDSSIAFAVIDRVCGANKVAVTVKGEEVSSVSAQYPPKTPKPPN